MKRLLCVIMSVIMITVSAGVITVAADDEGETTNLLKNSGFEEELAGGDEWRFTSKENWNNIGDTTAQRTNAEHRSGEYSAMLNKGTFGQRIALTAGKSYRLTAYVKADTATSSPQMGFYYDADDNYPSSHPYQNSVTISASEQWQEFTAELDCTETKEYVICLMTWNDTVNVYFDDVTLVEFEKEYDGNGIVNGDFSDGINGWTVTGDGANVADGALIISGTDYDVKVSQQVSGLDNGIYDLSVTAISTDINDIAYVYAKTDGHTIASTSIPKSYEKNGELVRNTVTVPGVIVENGKCDIGIYAIGASTITLDNFTFSDSAQTRVQFLKGGEISKLTYVEDMDGKFYRADGTEADALQIMAENGFNLARIRLLDDPGSGHGDGTYYLPEGYMDETDCLNLARRAKDKGMQIMFSIAYSDYWVDGDKQIIPYRWQEEMAEKDITSGEEKYAYLEDKVYEYTKDIIQKLIAQGTCPEFVALGNEIQVGILFGKKGSVDSGIYNNATMLARFLNAGAKAVRETSPETKIVLHSDNGGKLSSRSTFRNILSKVDYDVIGVSYYPFYNADVTIETVVSEFNSLISTYDKDVIIMETGYNWNPTKPGGWEGQLEDSGYYTDIYGEDQDGQRAFLTDLYAQLKRVAGGRCIGDLYWDPVMIYSPTYKIGWAIRESDNGTGDNVVPNSTIFDFDGKAVEGQKAMKYNTDSADTIKITGTVFNPRYMDEDAAEIRVLANADITINVDGKAYNTSTDRFGQYIISVPYPENDVFNSISMKHGRGTCHTIVPEDSFMVDEIDFYTESYVSEVKPEIGSVDIINGTITVNNNAYLEGEARGIIALYDAGGNLQRVYMSENTASKGRKVISFNGIEDISGTVVKAFLWKTSENGTLTVIPAATEREIE